MTEKLLTAAVRAAQAVGYVGAGNNELGKKKEREKERVFYQSCLY